MDEKFYIRRKSEVFECLPLWITEEETNGLSEAVSAELKFKLKYPQFEHGIFIAGFRRVWLGDPLSSSFEKIISVSDKKEPYQEYSFVHTENNDSEFNDAVNKMLDHGWKLQGGISISFMYLHHGQTHNSLQGIAEAAYDERVIHYAQAFVRDRKE